MARIGSEGRRVPIPDFFGFSSGYRRASPTPPARSGSDLSDLNELDEEELWRDDDNEDDTLCDEVAGMSIDNAGAWTNRRSLGGGQDGYPSSNQAIPRYNNNSGDFHARNAPKSAPVKIPDWSGVSGRFALSGYDDGEEGGEGDEEEVEEEDDGDRERVPPHELVARSHAHAHATSFSVFEGIGRTLKGRDASRVRNAVWSQTGFEG